MLNKYKITFLRDNEGIDTAFVFAGNEEAALEIFHFGFGEHVLEEIEFVRHATRREKEELEQTGAPHPRRYCKGKQK